MSPPSPYSTDSDGLRLAVRLTPRADRNALAGIVVGADGRPALAVRLNAPPVDGAANTALMAFLAKMLKLRRADITLCSGHTARLKILHLAGDPAMLAAKLEVWMSAG